MLRCSRALRCRVIESVLGAKPNYRPRVRPRKLVMPIDPAKIYSTKRLDPASRFRRERGALVKATQRHAAIKLATVPEERMVGEEFRLCLEACKTREWFDEDQLRPRPWVDFLRRFPHLQVTRTTTTTEGEDADDVDPSGAGATARRDGVDGQREGWALRPLQAAPGFGTTAGEGEGAAGALPSAATPSHSSSRSRVTSVVRAATSEEREREVGAAAYTLWDLLARTPLTAPPHGPLALRGRMLAEATVVGEMLSLYPRLRSHHTRQAAQHLLSFHATMRLAISTGFAERCDVVRDLSIFRELIALRLKLARARKEFASSKERHTAGVTPNALFHWQKQRRLIHAALARFPAEEADVLPRVQWVHHMMFAFIGFVMETEGRHAAQQLVRRVFMPAVASHSQYNIAVSALRRLTSEAAAGEAASPPVEDEVVRAGAAVLRELTSEDFVVGPAAHVHPLNARADQWRLRLRAGANHLSVEDYVDGFAEQEIHRHMHVAPALLMKLLTFDHAFKEAQIILRYAPDAPEALRHAPLDFERSVVDGTDVVPGDAAVRKNIDSEQIFRAQSYTEAKFFAGDLLLGVGRGEHDVAALNAAARHFLANFYFANPQIHDGTFRVVPADTEAAAASTAASTADALETADPAARPAVWSVSDYYHRRAARHPTAAPEVAPRSAAIEEAAVPRVGDRGGAQQGAPSPLTDAAAAADTLFF